MPVAPAVPTDAIWPVSMLWPTSMKNGWPATRFVTEATLTLVSPTAVAAAVVVMPGRGTLLASSKAVPPPEYCRIGVERIAALIVDG